MTRKVLVWGLLGCFYAPQAAAQDVESPPAAEAPVDAAPAPAPAPAEAAPPEDAPAVAASGADKSAIARSLITAWLAVSPPPPPSEMALTLEGYTIPEIKAVRVELGAQIAQSPDHAARTKLVELRKRFDAAVELIRPESYPLDDELKQDPCFRDPFAHSCSGRLDGFLAAAHNRVDGKKCWRLLANLDKESPKGPQFRQGYQDWWHRHAEPNDACTPPPKPPRCFVGACWGGDSGAKYGIAFRPAVQLGATFGEGLGFSEDDATFAGQFSGSLGARFFFLDDMFDLHAGAGIGASSAKPPASDEDPDPANKTQAFILVQLGVGVFNGLFGVSYLRTMDPRSGGPEPGNGASLYVDAAAVERIVSSEP